MDAPRTLPETPRTEDLTVFLVMTLPIFAVTVAIIVLILQLGPR
jgi:hypothetical protein